MPEQKGINAVCTEGKYLMLVEDNRAQAKCDIQA
jgi:BarA-like signal transduction histidine kinase